METETEQVEAEAASPQGGSEIPKTFSQSELERIVRERLEPLGEQTRRYKEAVEKYLAAEKTDLPKHMLVLIEKLDPLEQVEYLAANREELGKVSPAVLGVPASPSPKERSLSDEDQIAARLGQAALYSNF